MLVAFALIGVAASAQPSPPLYDPVTLNIGLSCQWQKHCIDEHRRAMRRSLKYVAKYHPPIWRIHQCNRNASRKWERVDWIGFNNCVRNTSLIYQPPLTLGFSRAAKRHRHTTWHHSR